MIINKTCDKADESQCHTKTRHYCVWANMQIGINVMIHHLPQLCPLSYTVSIRLCFVYTVTHFPDNYTRHLESVTFSFGSSVLFKGTIALDLLIHTYVWHEPGSFLSLGVTNKGSHAMTFENCDTKYIYKKNCITFHDIMKERYLLKM